MTNTIFLEDCYVKTIDAEIIAVEGIKIELDKSIFCYKGGGQLADNGTISVGEEKYKVVDVRKENGKIMNYIDREGLKIGDKAHCVLDWERRYILMREHTAIHILSAIINQKTGALITGGQIDLEKTRVDFSLENFDREKVDEYVKESNAAINRNMDIKMYFMNREEALKIPGMVKLANAVPPNVEQLRIVEIGDVDTQADGGTHVKNTSEIGQIEVLKIENKGKNNRRIHFKLA
jgi:Ser-tRNA(Ala) deacylase AlaX